MKNQYFGDVNDYRKYALLRGLQAEGNQRLLVAWMLTPDDGSKDGRKLGYLDKPGKWRHQDPELFDLLGSAVGGGRREVSAIEEAGLLARTSFFGDLVPDDRTRRAGWSERLLDAARGHDLVFLDPDNGIEVKSRPEGRKGSSKHVMWRELEALWGAGCSLLMYQHWRRENREAFVSRLSAEIASRLPGATVAPRREAHVAFLHVEQGSKPRG